MFQYTIAEDQVEGITSQGQSGKPHAQAQGMVAWKTSGNRTWEPPLIADPKLTSSSRTAGLSDTVKVSAIA